MKVRYRDTTVTWNADEGLRTDPPDPVLEGRILDRMAAYPYANACLLIWEYLVKQLGAEALEECTEADVEGGSEGPVAPE